MSRSYGASEYGNIPDDVYLKKIQVSPYDYDPYMIENHIRSELADFRPDAPFLASDEARDPNDPGGGPHSREMLNLRHGGARSLEDPYLEEGTFLDHEFLEKDTRGPDNLPNFRNARKQSEARGAFIKFYNDDNFSVPETGINPVKMRQNIRNSQHDFKNRYRNFSESFDGRSTKSAVPGFKTSSVALTTRDGTIINLTDATNRNRSDAVTRISNNIPGVMRLNTPDHRVKISKYGAIRAHKPMNDAFEKNRAAVKLDNKTVELNGQQVNRNLALLIMDIEGIRSNKQFVAQGASYGDSKTMQQHNNGIRPINPEDLYKLIEIGAVSITHAESAHEQLSGNIQRINAQMSKTDLRNAMNNSLQNIDVAHQMVQINKKLDPRKSNELRENIKQSANRDTLDITHKNINSTRQVKDTLKRAGIDVRVLEDSRQTKSYAHLKPIIQNKTHELTNVEQFGSYSRQAAPKIKKYERTHNAEMTENDVDMSEFADVHLPTIFSREYKSRGYQSEIGDTERREEIETYR